MGRLTIRKPRVPLGDHRRVRPAEKVADPFYQSPEWEAARLKALQRAKFRCEATVENGQRCPKRTPGERIFVDHRVERRDGGADLDQENLWCLCSHHHASKTIAERTKRMSR